MLYPTRSVGPISGANSRRFERSLGRGSPGRRRVLPAEDLSVAGQDFALGLPSEYPLQDPFPNLSHPGCQLERKSLQSVSSGQPYVLKSLSPTCGRKDQVSSLDQRIALGEQLPYIRLPPPPPASRLWHTCRIHPLLKSARVSLCLPCSLITRANKHLHDALETDFQRGSRQSGTLSTYQQGPTRSNPPRPGRQVRAAQCDGLSDVWVRHRSSHHTLHAGTLYKVSSSAASPPSHVQTRCLTAISIKAGTDVNVPPGILQACRSGHCAATAYW